MKFEINRNLLDQTVQNVSRGLSNKTPMPILMGILIKAKDNLLTFVTTNKEISIQIVLETNENLRIIEEGSCVVPGKYFVDIVKKIEGQTVDFTLFDESTIKIISDSSDFTLIAYDKNNFPKPNMESNATPLMISCKEFKQIVRQTNFACATSENRIILTSSNFKYENNNLTVICTDSFRLAKRTLSLESNVNKLQMNVPSKSLDEFVKVIPDSNDQISICIDSSKALFKFKNLSFMTRLVEGTFPDTKSLFPINYAMKLKFDKSSLIAAVDRASLFCISENLDILKITLKENDDFVELSSNSTEIGRVVETIKLVEKSENIDFQIAFSAKLLLEALKSFDSKEIFLNVTGEIKPAIISSDESPNLTQLLLPVRIF